MNKILNNKVLRNFIACLFVFVILYSGSAMAGSEDKAKEFVQSVGDKVIAVITSNKNNKEKESSLNELFVQSVDIDWIAKFVAGRYLREASAEQKSDYLKAYKAFLVNSYVSKFRQYTDQKMVITNAHSQEDGDFLVETKIENKDGKSYNVSYKTRKNTDGTLKIYDIIAEGVSMIATQRADFSSILSREGMTSLIEKLKSKS